MVRIISWKKSLSQDGKEFISLKVEGDVEPSFSQVTGRSYLKSKTAYVATTFSEETANSLIGKSIPGSVKKVLCDPYDYTVKETGEVIELSHRYEYFADEEGSDVSEKAASEKDFSFA